MKFDSLFELFRGKKSFFCIEIFWKADAMLSVSKGLQQQWASTIGKTQQSTKYSITL